jgi:hypothetical protein
MVGPHDHEVVVAARYATNAAATVRHAVTMTTTRLRE